MIFGVFLCSFAKMKKAAFLLLWCGFSVNAQVTVLDTINHSDNSIIYRTAETDTRPELVDGMYTLSMFISKNIELPDVNNRRITIFVGFIVETDSTISDIKYIYLDAQKLHASPADSVVVDLTIAEADLYEELKTQSVDAIAAFTGKWIPATKDGLPVRCRFNFPIIIQIE